MGETLKYDTWDLYNGQNTQIDGRLTDGTGEMDLDIWSTTEEDLSPNIAERAQLAWEKGEVLAEDFEGVTSLIVPIEPLSLDGIEQALKRFRPNATSVDLGALKAT
jgi:hypothetical protein